MYVLTYYFNFAVIGYQKVSNSFIKVKIVV